MKSSTKIKRQRRTRRHTRIRARVFGTNETPRLSVFKSHRYLWAQVIDDSTGKTLVSVSDREIQKSHKGAKQERAKIAGGLLAKKAKEAGIKRVQFDRGGFHYHGRLKVFADSAREAGLKF